MEAVLKSAVEAGPVVAGLAAVGTLFATFKIGNVS
jgi:hypothetical protein